jgi:SAM-dependent methyltransferase
LNSPPSNEPVAALVARFAGEIPGGGRVLDVACGAGRHSRYLSGLGYRVLAVDRDLSRMQENPSADPAINANIELMQADLELDPWPFESMQFEGIVVTNYLYRPHFPLLLRALAPGGVLIFETFAKGNERYGHPRNPDYLLEAGELLQTFSVDLSIISFEQGYTDKPGPSVRQGLCGIKNSIG